MNERRSWSRILVLPGIVAILLGIIEPGEGLSVLYVLSGIGLVALSAFLGKTRHRALVLGALGVGAIGLSARIALWVLEDRYSWWPEISAAEPVFPARPLHLVWTIGVGASLAGAALVLFEFLYAEDVPMNTRRWWSRTVTFVGPAMMALGAYLVKSDYPVFPYVIGWLLLPLQKVWRQDGWNLIPCALIGAIMLAGSGLAALGAYLVKSRYRRFLYVALALTACGLTTTLVLMDKYTYLAAPWWEVFCFTYPIGLIMSCVGAVLVLIESFRRAPVSQDGVGTV
ncbi:hypothetical protein [Candidatus Cryosericum terrychapinii]|jgi:hypothetical protein|uniref:Uncharacterized protein n=1 Tax=Candidatus Cryosericum terrychapinii TaxID=2290919 RepID=A0A398CSY9_9BACT|nr:hypothetical protein [Candidatus Cryosericum terrychapinii]RIE05735.1 hypothetical protein SMC7_06160 [Candidatus Cryosericum terrychapinii]